MIIRNRLALGVEAEAGVDLLADLEDVGDDDVLIGFLRPGNDRQYIIYELIIT